jgi:hypothetical protein
MDCSLRHRAALARLDDHQNSQLAAAENAIAQ